MFKEGIVVELSTDFAHRLVFKRWTPIATRVHFNCELLPPVDFKAMPDRSACLIVAAEVVEAHSNAQPRLWPALGHQPWKLSNSNSNSKSECG